MQRAVRRAADVGLAARHLEFAPGPGGRPQLAALFEIEDAGDPLERVRVAVERQPAVVMVQSHCAAVAAPLPGPAERVGRSSRGGGCELERAPACGNRVTIRT